MYFRYLKTMASETKVDQDSSHRDSERDEGALLLDMDADYRQSLFK